MADVKEKKGSNFRKFFLRGLGIVLPTILTIWILVAVYSFVEVNIAAPINAGVRELILLSGDSFEPNDEEIDNYRNTTLQNDEELKQRFVALGSDPDWVKHKVSQEKVLRWWNTARVGSWKVMNLIGLIIAIILIYLAGWLFGSIFGRRIYRRGELFLRRIPLFKSVYPHVKQVVEFLFGGGEKPVQFSNVVAVEYPRKGLWSVGLVTGDTLSTIQAEANESCYTVFVPSSPTPFTGYVITVPKRDTIDLPISIDDALRFTVSGGVIVPESQLITGALKDAGASGTEQKTIETSSQERSDS